LSIKGPFVEIFGKKAPPVKKIPKSEVGLKAKDRFTSEPKYRSVDEELNSETEIGPLVALKKVIPFKLIWIFFKKSL